ncbi:MAG TPA: hypothetical protein ENF80_02425 [Thermofilum sp.]|nr:hypothetical protein [Thermofilum sp.]
MSVSTDILLAAGVHAFFGLVAFIPAIWLLVEVKRGISSVKTAVSLSLLLSLMVWLAFLAGGWWYVTYYHNDKAVIKEGPLPWAHSIGMEAKEHLFFTGLLLSTMLPALVYAYGERLTKGEGSKLLLSMLILIIIGGMVMELLGGLISIGAKAGWMVKVPVEE